jgi:hypothetical protein
MYDGDYVAAAQLKKKQSYFYPLRSTKGIVAMKEDPYKAITSEILSDDLDRTMIQVVFKPANPNWSNGKLGSSVLPTRTDASEVAEGLRDEKLKNELTTETRDPSQEEMQLAEKVMEYSRRNAYLTNVRVVSFSPYREEARQNVWSLATAFERSYEETAGGGKTQSFTMVPAGGNKVDEMVLRSARREWKPCGTILTVPELAATAHIPNNSIETPAVTWNQTGKGARPPADMPRFDDPPERLPPGVRFTEADNDEEGNEEQQQEPSGTDDDLEPQSEPEPDSESDSEPEPEEEEEDLPDEEERTVEEPPVDATDPTDEDLEDDVDGEDDTSDIGSLDGIIGRSIPDETDTTTDAFEHTTNDSDDLTNNPNRNDNETTHTDTTADTDESDTTDTPDTNSDNDEEESSTPDREDPDDPSNSNSTPGVSSGFNKNVEFGSDPDEDDDTSEETNS